jgi:hypothetical protein
MNAQLLGSLLRIPIAMLQRITSDEIGTETSIVHCESTNEFPKWKPVVCTSPNLRRQHLHRGRRCDRPHHTVMIVMKIAENQLARHYLGGG